MVGGGFYNKNSSLQALVAESCGGLVSLADVQGSKFYALDIQMDGTLTYPR